MRKRIRQFKYLLVLISVGGCATPMVSSSQKEAIPARTTIFFEHPGTFPAPSDPQTIKPAANEAVQEWASSNDLKLVTNSNSAGYVLRYSPEVDVQEVNVPGRYDSIPVYAERPECAKQGTYSVNSSNGYANVTYQPPADCSWNSQVLKGYQQNWIPPHKRTETTAFIRVEMLRRDGRSPSSADVPIYRAVSSYSGNWQQNMIFEHANWFKDALSKALERIEIR